MTKNKLFSITVVGLGIFLGTLAFAQSSGNSSLTLVKDPGNGLFTITMSDSQGIASFSLTFKKETNKLPYSGDFAGCPTRKVLNNNAAVNNSDLAVGVKGKIIDCQGSETEFEISSVDSKGKAQVKKIEAEVEKEEKAEVKEEEEAEKVIEEEEEEIATAPEIEYPVKQLGNCKDKEGCFAYCELPENGKQCLEFAKKHKLLPEDEIRVAEKVLGVKGGPGGCNSKKSCEAFCNDIDHIDECVAFAEENGLMKGKELEEAKKVRAAVQRGQKMPGGCKNKNACENYCKDMEHMDECLAFAEEAGFLPPEELEQAKKFLPLMKSGETPGACKSKDECEAYCDTDEHFEECINFAEKHGMIPEEEREHIEAFKKAGGKGPGGCKGRQCQAFCETPENQEACFNWAKENGMMKEEDVRRMEQGKQQIEKIFTDAPQEVQDCINQAIPGGIEAMRSGKFFGGEAVGENIKECFEGFMSQMGGSFGGPDGEHGMPADFSGPGGCQGPEECMSYCKDNPEECQGFGPGGEEGEGFEGEEQGGFQGGGPGGCQGPEECMSYCKDNPEECQGFGPPSGDHEGFSPPDEFPGMGDNDFPSQGEFPEQQGEFPRQGEEFHPPEGVSPEQFQREFEKQGTEQFQQQYQQQYQQQMQQQIPPPGARRVTSPLGLLLAPFLWLVR